MRRRLVHANAVGTSIIEAGSGRPTILVHGTSSSAEAGWAAIMPRLASGRRCLAIDLAGSGETRCEGGELTLDLLVAQVAATAALVEGQDVDLVGYSLGAVVAAAAAASLPKRVRRLVLLGGWANTDLRMRVQFDLWETLARSDRSQLARLILLNGVSERFFETATVEAVDAILERFASSLAAGSDSQAALDATIDIRSLLPAIKADTLVIGLSQDRLVPPSHGRALARRIDGARYAEIDSGHLVMLEQPGRLLEMLEMFLD